MCMLTTPSCTPVPPTTDTANLQSDLNSLQSVLCDLTLLLNPNKTKTMIFTSGRAEVPTLSVTTLHGVPIQSVDCYKYLGVWLDKSLNFKHHIDYLSKKLKFTLGFLYRFKSCCIKKAFSYWPFSVTG